MARSATPELMHDHFDIFYTEKYRSVFNVKIKSEIARRQLEFTQICSFFIFTMKTEWYFLVYGTSKWSCIDFGVADLAVLQTLTR